MAVLKKTIAEYFNDPIRCTVPKSSKGGLVKDSCLDGINKKMKEKFSNIKEGLPKGTK